MVDEERLNDDISSWGDARIAGRKFFFVDMKAKIHSIELAAQKMKKLIEDLDLTVERCQQIKQLVYSYNGVNTKLKSVLKLYNFHVVKEMEIKLNKQRSFHLPVKKQLLKGTEDETWEDSIRREDDEDRDDLISYVDHDGDEQ